MTLVAAWVRATGSTEELVVASDSRLTGAYQFDEAPKIFPLWRGDCVLAFAGSTHFAYPLILQITRMALDYDRARSRAMDLTDFAGHCERVCTALVKHLLITSSPLPEGLELDGEFQLVLAGYSWLKREFLVWVSECDGAGNVTFTGAHHYLDSAVFVGSGKVAAVKELDARSPTTTAPSAPSQFKTAQWEPFDVLRDLIRSGVDRSVGGAPQLIKVYAHGNTMAYAIPWQYGKAQSLTLLGRRLLDYERTQRLVFDPDTHKASTTWRYL